MRAHLSLLSSPPALSFLSRSIPSSLSHSLSNAILCSCPESLSLCAIHQIPAVRSPFLFTVSVLSPPLLRVLTGPRAEPGCKGSRPVSSSLAAFPDGDQLLTVRPGGAPRSTSQRQTRNGGLIAPLAVVLGLDMHWFC